MTQAHENYVGRLFSRFGSSVDIRVPDFSCADLTNASFDGHPLFGLSSEPGSLEVTSYALVSARFFGANLTRTKFDEAWMFGITTTFEKFPFRLNQAVLARDKTYHLFQFSFASSDELGAQIAEYPPRRRKLGVLREPYKSSLQLIRNGFLRTNWRDAILPVALQKMLEADPPEDFRGVAMEPICASEGSAIRQAR
jgi:uncharacterized protein YjbI with pentapeptide repeats